MEKLELKHIAPYLPYGLKTKIDLGQGEEVVTENWGLKTGSDYPASYYNEGKRHGLMLSQIKPLLRPLSDLYKEIDGKYGIVELAKITTGLDWSKRGWELSDLNEVSINQDGGVISFSFNKGNFSLKYRARTKLNYTTWGISNQLDLFTYLFQHHYDVFGLIDKELAIDLNSINHE